MGDAMNLIANDKKEGNQLIFFAHSYNILLITSAQIVIVCSILYMRSPPYPPPLSSLTCGLIALVSL